jgi:cell division protease FtsH
MSQEPNKQDNKSKLPKFSTRPGEGSEPPKKGPRFSIYWVYALIFAVLIGFQILSPFGSSSGRINRDDFKQMVAAGDVEKYLLIDNRDQVQVFLKKGSIQKYEGNKNLAGKLKTEGPHAYFQIGSSEDFDKKMEEFYVANNIAVDQRPDSDTKNESNYLGQFSAVYFTTPDLYCCLDFTDA